MYMNRDTLESAVSEYSIRFETESDDETTERDKAAFCRTMEDLMGSKENFADIGVSPESSCNIGEEILRKEKLDQKLQDVQASLFRRPMFIEEKKKEMKKAQGEMEMLKLQQLAIEEEIKAKEAESRASAFQFDFGYLDAEVHDLLRALESVYPDVSPMPNTTTTKSVYTSTKANVEKLGLKVILNRLCIIGKYDISDPSETFGTSFSEPEANMPASIDAKKTFLDELTRIRCRADSVFAKELGEVTGCLLSYPKYFIVMFEGPELSIMDILHQGKAMMDECIVEGGVLFVAGHVMVRYLQEWTDLVMTPPAPIKNLVYDGNVDTAKENLVILSETCQRLWRIVANAKASGLNPSNCIVYDMLPEEKLIQYSMDCGLLRPLDIWLRRVTQLTFGDFVSESWPQIFYPWVNTAHKSDTQFDSLGVLDTYEDMPGLDQALEDFIKTKVSWKARENTIDNLDDVTRTLKEKLVKQGSIMSVLSAISRDTAYER